MYNKLSYVNLESNLIWGHSALSQVSYPQSFKQYLTRIYLKNNPFQPYELGRYLPPGLLNSGWNHCGLQASLPQNSHSFLWKWGPYVCSRPENGQRCPVTDTWGVGDTPSYTYICV